MVVRPVLIVSVVVIAGSETSADDALYRYEGNALPSDPAAGWATFNPCEIPCLDLVKDGHYVLIWAQPGDIVNFDLAIVEPDQTLPQTLWVEWRFRSSCPIGPNFFTGDGAFAIRYDDIFDVVYMYGDTVISFSGDDFIVGLDLDDFQTYRFESPDGETYRISVDGQVFITASGNSSGSAHLQLQGRGTCETNTDTIKEWDFVRYGTIASGEQIIASHPSAGFLDAGQHADLDRLTVTFDSANYVYVDEITVEVTGGVVPQVLQTRRRENTEPDTVEIVLDRPLAMGETTRFTFDDGVAVNVIEYTFAKGDTNGDGLVDLRDVMEFQNCFRRTTQTRVCAALDLVPDDTIGLGDLSVLLDELTGRSSDPSVPLRRKGAPDASFAENPFSALNQDREGILGPADCGLRRRRNLSTSSPFQGEDRGGGEDPQPFTLTPALSLKGRGS